METSIRDQITPEMTVAGSILLDPEAYSRVAEMLKPDDFHLDFCRVVFEEAQALYLEGEPVDAMLIKERAKDRLTGSEFVQLLDLTPTSQNVAVYAELTVQNARDRRLRQLCEEVIADRTGEVDDLLAKVAQEVQVLEERHPKSDTLPSARTVTELYINMQDRQEGKTVLRPTGLKALDGPLGGGMVPGSLYVLAGRPGMGKSTLALYIADELAKKGPVLYITLEMTPEQLTAKRVARRTGIPAQRLLTAHGEDAFSQEDWDKLTKSSSELCSSQFLMNRKFSLTTEDITRMARRQRDLQAIVVDHLGLLQSAAGRYGGRTELVTEISGALKRMALTLNVPVLALSQLNRASESNANQRPKLSNLRDSGSIEQDADVVMLLHRDDYAQPHSGRGNSVLRVDFAKNRFGSNETANVCVHLATDQVRDM